MHTVVDLLAALVVSVSPIDLEPNRKPFAKVDIVFLDKDFFGKNRFHVLMCNKSPGPVSVRVLSKGRFDEDGT